MCECGGGGGLGQRFHMFICPLHVPPFPSRLYKFHDTEFKIQNTTRSKLRGENKHYIIISHVVSLVHGICWPGPTCLT